MSKYATAASRALLSDEKCHPGTYVKRLDVVPTLARHVFRVRPGHISESGKDLNPMQTNFKLRNCESSKLLWFSFAGGPNAWTGGGLATHFKAARRQDKS